MSRSLSHAISIYDFTVKQLNGEPRQLIDYRGKVLLIVNTASKCGFTPQYKDLVEIYTTYRIQGFEILGFPCNQFGAQEPGSATEIGEFCEKNYDVNFPVFEKIDVNGDHTAPLYQYLKNAATGLFGSKAIKWNFTKFLIDKDGRVFRRYAPQTKPVAMITDIEKLLGK